MIDLSKEEFVKNVKKDGNNEKVIKITKEKAVEHKEEEKIIGSELYEYDLDWVLNSIRRIKQSKNLPENVKRKALDYIINLCE